MFKTAVSKQMQRFFSCTDLRKKANFASAYFIFKIYFYTYSIIINHDTNYQPYCRLNRGFYPHCFGTFVVQPYPFWRRVAAAIRHGRNQSDRAKIDLILSRFFRR